MAKSKYQMKAKSEVIHKKENGKPKYYDENEMVKKSSPAFALFIGFIIIIAGTIVGVGSYLDKQNTTEDNNTTLTYTGTSTEDTSTSSYKTPLVLNTITGATIRLEDYAGKVVVLYFHYIDCYYCQDNGNNLNTVKSEYSSTELLVIAIDVQAGDSVDDINAWALEKGYNWPNVRDTDYSLSTKYSVSGTPTMVFLGKDGSNGNRLVGLQSENQLRTAINSLL